MTRYLRVLLIQKCDQLRLELASDLFDLGVAEVTAVSTYEEGLLFLQELVLGKRKLQVLVLDGADRIEAQELINQMMSNELLSEIKIVILREKNANMAWAFQLGAFGHINKPLDLVELKKFISHCAYLGRFSS